MNTVSSNLAGQFFNVFSNQDLVSLSQSLNKISDRKNQGKFYAYTNGFEPGDLIYAYICKKILNPLEKIFQKKLYLTVGMLLKEQIPWGIHTDYVKDDLNPDLAILIPLNTEPLLTHTVVFEQLCLTSFNEFIKNNKKLKLNATNLHDNLMSHETLENLEYVSLLSAYAWVPGSVIYWDRTLLHASDNFKSNGIETKNALVLFTHQD